MQVAAERRNAGSATAFVLPTALYAPSVQWASGVAGGLGVLFVVGDSGLSPLMTVAIATVIQAVTAGVVLVWRAWGSASAGVRAATVVLAGAIRGLLVVGVLHWSGAVESPGSALVQVVASMVFTAVWMCAAAMVAQGDRDYRDEFAGIFERAVADAQLAASHASPWVDARELAAEERKGALDLIARIEPGSAGLQAQLADVALHLHKAIDQRVRPASHALWQEGVHAAPSLSVGTVLLHAATRWTGSPVLAALAAALVGGFGALIATDVPVGLFTAVVVGLTTAVVMGLRSLIAGQSQRALVGRFALLAALVLATAAMLQVLGVMIGLPPRFGGVLLLASAGGAVALGVTAVVGLARQREAVLAEMQALLDGGFWRLELMRSVRSQQAREAGTYLHHRVQSDLLSAALHLEMASRSDDPVAVVATLTQLRARLHDDAAPVPPATAGRAALAAVREDWAGICDVSLTMPDERELPLAQWARVDLIVREAVANAVRAGRADRISVRVARVRADLIIDVVDNGTAAMEGSAGLGSRMLAAVAPGAWQLSGREGCRHLLVRLPSLP